MVLSCFPPPKIHPYISPVLFKIFYFCKKILNKKLVEGPVFNFEGAISTGGAVIIPRVKCGFCIRNSFYEKHMWFNLPLLSRYTLTILLFVISCVGGRGGGVGSAQPPPPQKRIKKKSFWILKFFGFWNFFWTLKFFWNLKFCWTLKILWLSTTPTWLSTTPVKV